MRTSVRAYDHVGRYGGEEFLFILPGCDTENARNQAERLKIFITSQPVELPTLAISFTISIGTVVKYDPVLEDLDSLVQAADAALYAAKVQGRNRVVVSECSDFHLKSLPALALAHPHA
jgi:diguanylate cyclase (GGDEF)-like protein